MTKEDKRYVKYCEYCVDKAKAWMQGAAFVMMIVAIVLLVLAIIGKVTLYAVGIVLVAEIIAAVCGYMYMAILDDGLDKIKRAFTIN